MRPTPFLEITQISPGEFRRDGTYQNWRPRGTRDWLFIHTVEGSGWFQGRDRQVYRSRPGDCTLYEPGAWQRYDTDPEVGIWRLQWAHFHPLPHWRPWLNWPSPWKGFRMISLAKPGSRKLVETEMRRLIHAFRTKPRLAGDFALQIMGEILLQIQAERLDHPSSRMDERILRAIEIMASHFHEPTSLPRLASRCGLSLSRFAHLFKEQTGITPQRLLEENRLRHAAHLLLSTGLMVFEIASEVGYESPFYFSNRFRRFWGKTPSAFRRAGAAGLNSPKARRS